MQKGYACTILPEVYGSTARVGTKLLHSIFGSTTILSCEAQYCNKFARYKSFVVCHININIAQKRELRFRVALRP